MIHYFNMFTTGFGSYDEEYILYIMTLFIGDVDSIRLCYFQLKY